MMRFDDPIEPDMKKKKTMKVYIASSREIKMRSRATVGLQVLA
jgi:hypothetical protein